MRTGSPSERQCCPRCRLWLGIGMADDVINLTYGGSLFDVDLFAELLREEGLTVAYELPQLSEEERTEGPWEIATVVMSVTGPLWPAVWTAIRRFKASRLRQRAEISGPPELELSTEDRLALLDRLRDRGKISEEEHAQHRARILGDL
jgi:hypothetical protein